MKKGNNQSVKIGGAIRVFREKLGVTQDDFAAKIGMHRSYDGDVERGTYNFTLSTLNKVCAGLGVKIWQVFQEADV
jgi:transcriptional regulator with XRE-family HTH domain